MKKDKCCVAEDVPKGLEVLDSLTILTRALNQADHLFSEVEEKLALVLSNPPPDNKGEENTERNSSVYTSPLAQEIEEKADLLFRVNINYAKLLARIEV